jgi:hypothetical protein
MSEEILDLRFAIEGRRAEQFFVSAFGPQIEGVFRGPNRCSPTNRKSQI